MKKSILSLVVMFIPCGLIAQPGYYMEVLVGETEQESEPVDDTSLALRGGFQLNDYLSFELAYQDYGSNKDIGTIVFPAPTASYSAPVVFADPAVIPVFAGIAFPISEMDFSIESKTTAINLGVKGQFAITENLLAIGRIGVSRSEVELDALLPFQQIVVINDAVILNETEIVSISESEKGTSLYYGLGLQYDINSRFFTGLEYQINDIDFSGSEIKTETFSLSAGFRF